MTYQAFQDDVLTNISSLLPSEATISIHSVLKNNGLILDGLSIKERDVNIAPTIYLNDLYRSYERGSSMDAICTQIAETYERFKLTKPLDITFFTDYESAEKRIFYKLISAEKNREILEKIPHVPFLDMAIVFCCKAPLPEDANGTILINNDHTGLWGKTTKDLMMAAEKNTRVLFPPLMRHINDIIKEINPALLLPSDASFPMYVLTNENMLFGASVILYQDYLQDLSEEFESDLIIIPSSIHEVILIKDRDISFTIDTLKELIHDVNYSEVSPAEVLSDIPYRYSREEKKITCL